MSRENIPVLRYAVHSQYSWLRKGEGADTLPGYMAYEFRMQFIGRRMASSPLIYDIGANNGDDTDFYLRKGFRVVAVEADPDLCASMRSRFVDAIAESNLVIENVGAGDTHTEVDFYVNSFKEWSSFNRGSKATSQQTFRVAKVQIEPLSEIVARHGLPYYIKIDIEGHELLALRTLEKMPPPRWLSFEVNLQWRDCLNLARQAGFSRFSLVRQGAEYLLPPPDPSREGLFLPMNFESSMSGIFGADLPDDCWTEFDRIVQQVEDEFTLRKARVSRGERPGWYDIHCGRPA